MLRGSKRLIIWLVGIVTGSLMCFVAEITDVLWQEFVFNSMVCIPLYLFACWIDDLGEETCSDI